MAAEISKTEALDFYTQHMYTQTHKAVNIMINKNLQEKYYKCTYSAIFFFLLQLIHQNKHTYEFLECTFHNTLLVSTEFPVALNKVLFFNQSTGPSCSKLTMSLVNDSLKFTSSDTQIHWNFLLKKCE